MDICIVNGNLRYLVQGFNIMKLGNWGDGTDGGGNLEVRSKVEVTCQCLTHSGKIVIEKHIKCVGMWTGY